MGSFLHDLRDASRSLARSPGTSILVVLTLGVGIGAATAISTLVHAVLLRPLPFPDSESLVRLCARHESLTGFCVVSPPDLTDFAAASQTLEGLALGREWWYIWRRPEGSLGLDVGLATPGFLAAFGLEPAAGRFFEDGDVGAVRRPVAVVSHGFWQEHLGGDAGVLGRRLDFDEGSFEVVGVTAPELSVPGLGDVALWVPLHVDPRDEEQRSWRGFAAVGRLRPGVELEAARTELDGLAARLAEVHPETNEGWGVEVRRLRDQVALPVRETLLTFFGAVALLLLVACVNVANLLLARAAGRRQELALRAALGAGRGRLMARVFAEGLVLATAGGVLGLVFAGWLVERFVPLKPRHLPRWDEVSLDASTVVIAVSTTLLTTLVFGLLPAWKASASDPAQALRGAGSGLLDRATAGPRRALVIAEVALASVVLVAAGLLLRTFLATAGWEGGFETRNLLTFSAFFPTDREDGESPVELQHRMVEALESLPGVSSAGATSAGPLFGGREPAELAVLGSEDREPFVVRWFDVDPGYFRTLGTPLLRGRGFDDGDHAGAPWVAIVNESLARRIEPSGDALGRRVETVSFLDEPLEVVGVVADVRPDPPATEPELQIYWPKRQYPRSATFFVVRSEVDPKTLVRPIEARLKGLEPDLDLHRFATFEDLLGRKLEAPFFSFLLLALFAAAALVLAIGGTYGVMAHTVARSTREIGLRMALGASRGEILRWVLGSGGRLALVGIAIGIAGGLAVTRVMTSLLYGVSPADPLTYAATALVLLLAVVLACYLPARRAAAVDPMSAMRCE